MSALDDLRDKLGLEDNEYYRKKALELEGQKTKNNKKENNNFSNFKSSYFNDGYQFGDVSKTIGATGINALNLLGKSTLKAVENIAVDTPMALTGLVLSKLDALDGKVDKQENLDKLKKIISTDLVDKYITKESNEKYKEGLSSLEDASLIKKDNIAGQIVQGIGGMVPSILTGGSDKIGKVSSYLTLGARSFGSASEEALANGAQIDEATLYGILNTAVEIGSEMVTGGIPGTNTHGWLDKLTDKEISKISNKIIKKIAKSGYSFVGEASEEALAEILNPIIKNMSYTEGETIDWNAVVESAIVGGLTGQILNAPSDFSSQTIDNYSGQIISNNNQITNINEQSNNNQMNTDNQQNTNNITESITNEINQIENQVINNEISQEVATKSLSELKNDLNVLKTWQESQKVKETNTINKEQVKIIDDLVNKVDSLEKKVSGQEVKLPIVNNMSFEEQIKQVMNNAYPKRDMIVVSQNTPKLLQEIGLKNLPITMTQKHLYSITNSTGKYENMNYHDIPIEIIKQIPYALEHPLNILKSNTKNDSIVVVTELADKNDNIIVASIKLDGKGTIQDIRFDTNVMTSAYGKSGNYDYFMKDNIAKGNLLYDIDEGIIKTFKDIKQQQKKLDVRDRVQFPMRDSSTSTSDIPKNTSPINDNIIANNNENVKLPTAISNNSMQNNENNTVKLPKNPTKEDSYAKPEKLAKILDERPTTIDEKENWLKKFFTIKILDKGYYVDKLARKTKNKELSSKYDYMLSANGIAQQIIGNKRFNPKTQKVDGKGLFEIFEPIENSGKLKDFSEYMYHKHNISRMNLNNLFQEDNKPIFGDSITSENSQQIVENFEKINPEFVEWAKDIYDYNNFLLDVLVSYGVITSDDKKYYNKKYPNYVPTIRVNDKVKTQMELIGKKASINIPIKKAKGGNQDIIPLKEAMSLRTMQTINSALKNNFGNELLDTIFTEAEKEQVNVDNLVDNEIDNSEFITEPTKNKSATLTIFKSGEKMTFDISDEIYEALVPSNRKRIKLLNNISKLRRALITEYNPSFMLTNPIKDVQDGSLNSKHPKLFIKNIAEATKQIKTKGDFYKLYIANGGSYQTYFNYGEGYNKMPIERNKLDPRRILDKISKLNQEIEMTPRLAEFIASLEAGDTIETSMYNAQEITTNFKRGGDWTKNLDANGATFLNASVQGTMKQIRNFQEAKSQGTRGMMNLAVKWSIAGLTPYILSQIIWGDDDDYEELSDYIKNNYYILWKNENGEFIRIPKGRVVSVIQNLFKQSLDSLNGEKIDISEFLDLLQNQVLPSDPTESSIISPITDVIQNKTWYGGNLIPQRLQNLPDEEQYDESTDSISIWLGNKLGISPIKINYILDQYSGAIGDIVLPMLTLEAENDSNSFMGNAIAPIKDKFTADSVVDSGNVGNLYDLSDELSKNANSLKATDSDILKNKYINSKKTEMNKLYQEKRIIQNDKTLTNAEKYKQARLIQQQINELAKESISKYDDIEINGDFATINNMYFYKNKNDEWTKISSTDKSLNLAIDSNINMEEFIKYKNTDFVADKDSNGKTIANSRKHKIINYVNNLNLTIPEKAIIIKMEYSSFDDYNKEIVNYINQQDMGNKEKISILEELGFEIRNGRVYW